MNQVEATVISNTAFFPDYQHASKGTVGTWLMWLECPGIAAVARPGQFVMVRCGELTLPRPFSIHQAHQDGIAILYSVLAEGKGTTWLRNRRPDEKLQVFGPLGNGFTVNSSSHSLLLVAGGMGVAPLRFLAQHALGHGLKVTLLLGAQTGSLLYQRHLLPAEVKVSVATDDGTSGRRGPVTEMIAEHAGGADRVFACGPIPMYRDMAARKKELGLEGKPVQVSLEAVMACGHGACYGCTIKTRQGLKQVCHDGPVFDWDDILWEEVVLP